MNKTIIASLGCALTLSSAATLRAGGFLEQIDITGLVPSPIAGHVVGKLVPIRWDVRSIPVQYQMNTTLDPIPNPLGTPLLTLAGARDELQRSLDAWNVIRTSYVELRITGTTANAGVRGFDFRNELTFRTANTFTAIASSPSVSLIEDAEFLAGDDIDADGDSDVSNGIAVVTDTDGDGDLEFPAGFYKAGTILDNDVQFNTKTTNGFRFTIDPAAMDTTTRSVDLMAVAVHEFGHSIGLSHTLDNQNSASDGTGSTMFPFIDTGDPATELAQRSLEADDIAWASYHYPEGTAKSGPAARTGNDKSFDSVYGLIRGEVQHGVLNQPVAGASVRALTWHPERFVAAGFSGTTQVSVAPNGGLFLVDPAFNILDGKYTIPVPLGIYAVGIEAMDGSPVPAQNVSISGQIGAAFGQLNFNEEFYNWRWEDAVETRPGDKLPVLAVPGHTRRGVDFITTKSININNFGSLDFVGLTGLAGGSYYAVRVPASQITQAAAAAGGELLFHSVAIDTFVVDASVAPVYAEVMLTTGSAAGSTATVDLVDPLARATGFLGQDNDFAPFYMKFPRLLGRHVLSKVAEGTITDLFMVLRLPAGPPFPGVSNIAPLIGLDGGVATNDAPIFGLSYVSTDGVTFNQRTDFNFRFSLVVSEP